MAAAAWLLGVALGAGGRYGGALTVLAPLVEAGRPTAPPPERRLFGALSGATIASIHRQLGRHAIARERRPATRWSSPTGPARRRSTRCSAWPRTRWGSTRPTRPPSRLGRGRGGAPRQGRRVVAPAGAAGLGAGGGGAARGAAPRRRSRIAAEAVQRAEDARAPRHVAKGLLLQGIAQVSTGDERGRRHAAPVRDLRRVAGLRPAGLAVPGAARRRWSPRSRPDVPRAPRASAAARSAVLAIAGDLPPGVRCEWLARPDITALLEG